MKQLEPFTVAFSGINLIEASAGTGKTYNITSLYIRALIELDISVGKILVVTYTEAATKELKDRLLKRIRQSISVLKKGKVDNKSDQFLCELLQYVEDRDHAIEQLEGALRSFDESAIYTIHGFCYQALQEQAFESRAMYDAELIGDDSELVLEAVDDFWRTWVAEVSVSAIKQPLLKLLMDKGYEPESLATELGPHLGKPYLEVLPREVDDIDIDRRLENVNELYKQLRESWKTNRGEIFELLDAGHLSYYRTDWLEGWMQKMNEMLSAQTPPITFFDKFERFVQSYIDNSLKSASEKKGIRPPQHTFFKLAEKYQEAVKPLQNYEVIFKERLLEYLRKELDQKKEELQVLSYDDLLLRLRNALFDKQRGRVLADKLRQKYPIAMVDEFQDTDPSQYDIFRQVYKDSEASLFMIGDPKQSIYSFRGADVFSYLKAKEDAPKENTYDLGRNFRSVPKLIEGLNTFWGKHDNPFILDRIPYDDVEAGKAAEEYKQLKEYSEEYPPIRFRPLPLQDRDQFNKTTAAQLAARDTANEIYRLIEGGKSGEITIGKESAKAKDIAVLVRTHKQATLMADELRDKGIKSVQYSQESVFDSEEAAQLETLLKAIIEPSNETQIKTALALPLTGYTAKDLFEIEDDGDRWISVLDQFSEWHKMWQEKGFSAMFRSVIKEAEISEQLIQYSDGERRLTNLLHLGELMQAEALRQKDGMRGLLKWLARKRKEEGVQQDEEQLRLESDQDLVKIVTMHRSKGLEYPIVFCPFLWYGPRYQDRGKPLVYHDPENYELAYLDLNGTSDADRSHKRLLAAREELAESLRLAYVAMTRAEHCCYISWAYASKSEFSPLGYLLLDSDKSSDLLEETISNGYDAVGNQRFKKALEQLCNSNPTLFTMDTPSGPRMEDQQLELINFDDDVHLKARSFSASTPIESSYSISSFSSLSSWMEDDNPDVPDYDQFLDYADTDFDLTTEREEKSMFSFPKGPQPGTCIHNIFENIDFASLNSANEVISEQLEMQGIDREWESVVANMLDSVLNKPIHPTEQELKLSSLKQEDLIPEMEFYYQNEEIKTRQLLSIIRDGGNSAWENRGKAESGFLKGFIDLTFRFGDKYYLLDYKTNYLGGAYSDYRQEQLKHEMLEASYDLQYHIYTIALHRFLSKKLPGYSYENNFGGSFYLFLRGINPKGREGIFFDCPDWSVIRNLNAYISGQNNE